MNWQTATALFITGVIVLCIVYDLIAYSVGGSEATISSVCLNTANRNRGFAMAFAFCFGLLCGHIFLPQKVETKQK